MVFFGCNVQWKMTQQLSLKYIDSTGSSSVSMNETI